MQDLSPVMYYTKREMRGKRRIKEREKGKGQRKKGGGIEGDMEQRWREREKGEGEK